jgi:isoquinoline 1-oxidoreductase beta subunit
MHPDSGKCSTLPLRKPTGVLLCLKTTVVALLSISPAARSVDAGFAMHPDGLKAQMESGIVYGLTAALYSNITIHQGAVVQSNFHDYPMLRMNESPQIETWIINSGEEIGGGGEPATPPIAPALVNAIFAATGKRIRELPVQMHDLAG